ncbi:MAG: VacJ family lipoprotein [Alphaproteobacteria bacterium]
MRYNLLGFFYGAWLLVMGGAHLSVATPAASPVDSYKVQKEKTDRYEGDLDDDPFEVINRKIFAFNEVVDGVLIDPVANMYRLAVPLDVQMMISNVLHNTSEPLIFINDCLQKKKNKALESFSRFFINTVFGIFGLFDVARHLGLEAHKEGFNTTLKHWGVPQGPYLVLPIFGPANPRYIGGLLGDYIMDPINYHARQQDKESWLYWRTSLQFLTARANITEDIKSFRENSLDFYAAMRSFYKQYMDANRMDGKVHYSRPSVDEFMFDDDMELDENV